MTILFLDSSSFVKMFLDEMASVTLRGTLSQVGDDAKAISALAQVEVRSAIQRRFRNREFSSQTLSTAVMDLEVVVAEWVRIPINER